MTLEIRRVVTGHDADNKACVVIDEISRTVMSRRPGQNSTVIWATDAFPSDEGELRDLSADIKQTTQPGGTVFRIIRFDPGVAPRMHRTASIDYIVVISGEVDMEMDEGRMVHLKAGDVMVQRATVHNWINNGTEPCLIAFVLVDARLPEALDAEG